MFKLTRYSVVYVVGNLIDSGKGLDLFFSFFSFLFPTNWLQSTEEKKREAGIDMEEESSNHVFRHKILSSRVWKKKKLYEEALCVFDDKKYIQRKYTSIHKGLHHSFIFKEKPLINLNALVLSNHHY